MTSDVRSYLPDVLGCSVLYIQGDDICDNDGDCQLSCTVYISEDLVKFRRHSHEKETQSPTSRGAGETMGLPVANASRWNTGHQMDDEA